MFLKNGIGTVPMQTCCGRKSWEPNLDGGPLLTHWPRGGWSGLFLYLETETPQEAAQMLSWLWPHHELSFTVLQIANDLLFCNVLFFPFQRKIDHWLLSLNPANNRETGGPFVAEARLRFSWGIIWENLLHLYRHWLLTNSINWLWLKWGLWALGKLRKSSETLWGAKGVVTGNSGFCLLLPTHTCVYFVLLSFLD